MSTKISDRFNSVIDAVCYWLGYQFKIGRQHLVHEASLRYPIADSITAIGVDIQRVVLERTHPVFKGKRIDLVIFADNVANPVDEQDDSYFDSVYEFKIANSKSGRNFSDEHQRIFNDIARLAYYNLWNSKECYFLICGSYQDFKTYFVGQQLKVMTEGSKNILPQRPIQDSNEGWKPDGLYKDWFSFKPDGEKEITFQSDDHEKWGLKSFQENFLIRPDLIQRYTFELTVRTKCLAITPYGLENQRTHAAGIWKVEGLQK